MSALGAVGLHKVSISSFSALAVMSPIKVGFVGLSSSGWASIALAPGLLQHPSLYKLTAVSTTSPASASESAKKYSEVVGHPVKPFFGDTSKIANDPDVDLVVVSVKAPAHRDALLPAIEAGKNVFVEWPGGLGLEGSSEIAEAARKKGVRTMIGLQGPHSPVVKKVRYIWPRWIMNAHKFMVEGQRNYCIWKDRQSLVFQHCKWLIVAGIYCLTHYGFLQIAMAPQELGSWGPFVSEKNPYTVDGTQGKYPPKTRSPEVRSIMCSRYSIK